MAPVANLSAAIEPAFRSAERTILVGSITPPERRVQPSPRRNNAGRLFLGRIASDDAHDFLFLAMHFEHNLARLMPPSNRQRGHRPEQTVRRSQEA